MHRDLFRFDTPAAVADWSAIDDGVMGGISRSHLRHDAAGFAVFEGTVSLERNGGFASVRSHPLELGVEGATHFVVDLCGDGKRYKLNLRTDDAFEGVNYQAGFDAPAGVWVQQQFCFDAFIPTFRGQTLADAPALNPLRIRQIGLMIADRQEGAFALALRSISAG